MKITAQAHARVQQICAPHEHMRVRVEAGGCSGFQHVFEIDTTKSESDLCDQQVVWDATSHEILQNATLDWRSDLSGSQFVLQVPEATSACGCGKSFSLF